MRIHRVAIMAFFIMSLLLSSFIIGCSENGNTDKGDGNENGNPAITGEMVGTFTYITTWGTDPGTGQPRQETTLDAYIPLIEDEDGNLFRLSAPMDIHFEYDGMTISEVIVNIAGYTYTDYAPFNEESRYVGGETRQISHTGIQAIVTGTIDTMATGSFSGDMINVETIEVLP